MTADELLPFAPGVWVTSEPVRFLGMRLAATMAVLRLGDGSLLLHSPLAMTPSRRSAIEALGPVAHLYAPNLRDAIAAVSAKKPNAAPHSPQRRLPVGPSAPKFRTRN
jgi:hypothetical protein